MIKTFTAFTEEIDDSKLAVSEIMEQLDVENLGANTIGIITCYAEFIETGVVKAICDSLPFEVAGITTMENAVNGAIGDMLLTLMVLTGDTEDVSFSLGLSEALSSQEDEHLIRKAYEKASAGHEGSPALIISFAPLIMSLSGDFYVDCMDRISGGVPNFGTLAIDHTSDYGASRVICNGESYRDRYAFMLVYGDIKPSFFVGSVSDENVFRDKGAITASSGNLLQTVNNMSAIDYLMTIGLTKDENGNIAGINTFPFIVNFNDGTPAVVRAVYALTEEGYAVCGGSVPVGATLSVGTVDGAEVLSTSKVTLEKALASGKSGGMLIFSCIGRYFAQGYHPQGEAEIVSEQLEKNGPFYFACSGGELCPVPDETGALKNRNHNDTIIFCVF